MYGDDAVKMQRSLKVSGKKEALVHRLVQVAMGLAMCLSHP